MYDTLINYYLLYHKNRHTGIILYLRGSERRRLARMQLTQLYTLFMFDQVHRVGNMFNQEICSQFGVNRVFCCRRHTSF
jgi:hypothetical protein